MAGGLLFGVLLLIGTGVALWWATKDMGKPNVVGLQFAGEAKVAKDLLSQGTADTVGRLRSSLNRDWFLIPAYMAALGWWCVYGSHHFRMRPARRLARVLAWSMLLAGAADAVENVWLYRLLNKRGDHDAAAAWTTAMAIPKWLLIVCAIPITVAALFTGVARVVRRATRGACPPCTSCQTETSAIKGSTAPVDPVLDPRSKWRRQPGDNRWDWNSTTPAPSKELHDPTVGMCFSGGGIRSATFNMGTLQTVAAAPVPDGLGGSAPGKETFLGRSDFLSCVSGGAYIAGALQILAHQNRDDSDPLPFKQGSPEEHHVRLHGRYIADTLGDWVSAIARVLCGTLLNLLIFGLVLFVVARPLGWVQHSLLFRVDEGIGARQALRVTTDGMWFSVGWTAALGVLVLLVATVCGAVESRSRRVIQTAAFGLLTLSGLVLLMVWFLPTIASLVPRGVEWIGDLLGANSNEQKKETGGTIILLTAGGSLMASAMAIINRPTPPPESGKAPKWLTFKNIKKWAGPGLPYAAAAILWALALVVLAIFTSQAAHAGLHGPKSFFNIEKKLEWQVWAAAAGLLALLYATADQTRWSLGPFYRRRLASAFAMKRRSPSHVEELPWDERTDLSTYAVPHPNLPEVMVCAAANLSEQSAAPPGRRAASFVFGPDVVGGPEVGWSTTADYEAACRGTIRSDSTFLSAVAISGAAFASAMGRHSKGAINALLAASNARLGVWLPNPRYIAEGNGQVAEPQYVGGSGLQAPDPPAGVTFGTYAGPRVTRRRFSYLFKELFGAYSLDDRFLYLTDGGHYENLGLVELFRRRCRVILCFDASGDDLISCGTFVEALTLAEEELGVRVKIDLAPLAPRKAATTAVGNLAALDGRLSAQSVVCGTITYPGDATPGHIVLAKASLTSQTPMTVLAHAARQKKASFPNDSTGDQFFDESQFNAYLALGRHIAEEALHGLEVSLAPPSPDAPPPPRQQSAPACAPSPAPEPVPAPVPPCHRHGDRPRKRRWGRGWLCSWLGCPHAPEA